MHIKASLRQFGDVAERRLSGDIEVELVHAGLFHLKLFSLSFCVSSLGETALRLTKRTVANGHLYNTVQNGDFQSDRKTTLFVFVFIFDSPLKLQAAINTSA